MSSGQTDAAAAAGKNKKRVNPIRTASAYAEEPHPKTTYEQTRFLPEFFAS